MLFPPDTDTPGFAEENKIKPRECSEVRGVTFCLPVHLILVWGSLIRPMCTYERSYASTCVFCVLPAAHTTHHQVSAAGGLFTPQDVAAACLKGIKKNKYTITVVRALRPCEIVFIAHLNLI